MVRAITFAELRSLCPDSWTALTVSQYERIFSHWDLDKEAHERDYFKLLCILTDTPFKEVNPNPQKEAAVYELTRWVNETGVPFTRDPPKTITVDSVPLTVPDDLGDLSIGQMIIGRQLVDKSRYLDECIGMGAAIMLQPVRDGRFDYAKAKELSKEIGKMRASEIYPIGFFLLSHVQNNGLRRLNFFHKILNSLSGRLARMLRLSLRVAG